MKTSRYLAFKPKIEIFEKNLKFPSLKAKYTENQFNIQIPRQILLRNMCDLFLFILRIERDNLHYLTGGVTFARNTGQKFDGLYLSVGT